MKERYKIELGLGRYFQEYEQGFVQEYECRLYVRNNWWVFHWWCHLRTVRDNHVEIAKQVLRWQKRFDIPDENIIDLTVDHTIDYEI